MATPYRQLSFELILRKNEDEAKILKFFFNKWRDDMGTTVLVKDAHDLEFVTWPPNIAAWKRFLLYYSNQAMFGVGFYDFARRIQLLDVNRNEEQRDMERGGGLDRV
ncbi:hypothetical protein VNO78_08704 [Psophocarpus tetragonolobus]|uniref:Uncharacterized protein n=1 Tax=Psophocarpus tetragonolobus TaxID=3891 RepID=A0AAN9XTM6_PSOTE